MTASPPDPRRVRDLAAALGIPETVCAVLVVRGIHGPDPAKDHLRPLLDHLGPPDGLRDADRASARLLRAVAEGETVLVHGDYDVDGISATALYTRWLRRLGGRVEPFIPHRLRDGYDFGSAGLEAARSAGATVVLTADCGTVAHDAVERAGAAGLDVIVTDHHTPGDALPPALAVVNPNRADCDYPDGGLSGAGVAFKLCSQMALDAGVPFEELVPDLDLVALATVADLVPLQGENRVLVRYGLRALERTTKPGLRALLDLTGRTGKPVGTGQVAFGLAPRINAVGRMGHGLDALRLLLTDDADRARELAVLLDETNRVRQEEDRRTLDEALDLLARDYDPGSDFGVVLAAEGWHPGVIGIVASRIVERIHRPTVLVALDGERGRGSARSIPGFHLHDAVRSCARHLERFGGHRQAAGMDLRRDRVPAFREAFGRVARERLGEDDLRPRLRIDLETGLGGLDLRTCDVLEYLGPHGVGNPRPVFLVRNVRVVGSPRVVGSGHLKMRLGDGTTTLEAIGFGLAERHGPRVSEGSRVDAVFQL
ncbi:MAG TPA: single-stranded-DNA-specific exonuclease RecJ, partial [Longimicrobiales bacterium]|nr:single-stranded-DNA-specific exonuclease RecJ [Longimicrobiales bacterium]